MSTGVTLANARRVLNVIFGFYVCVQLIAALIIFTPALNSLSRNNREREVALFKLLRCAAPVMEEYGIPYFLDEGTLLGAYRNGTIINGDTDVDIGLVSIREFYPRWDVAVKKMESRCNARMVSRGDNDIISSIFFLGTFRYIKRVAFRFYLLDSYTQEPTPWYLDFRDYEFDQLRQIFYDRHFLADEDTAFIPVHSLLPIRKTENCTVSNVEFMCPSDPEAVLRREYGPEWHISISGFKTWMLPRGHTATSIPNGSGLTF